jgi:hypothetical protein
VVAEAAEVVAVHPTPEPTGLERLEALAVLGPLGSL